MRLEITTSYFAHLRRFAAVVAVLEGTSSSGGRRNPHPGGSSQLLTPEIGLIPCDQPFDEMPIPQGTQCFIHVLTLIGLE